LIGRLGSSGEDKTTEVSDSTEAIEAVAVVEVIEEVIEEPTETEVLAKTQTDVEEPILPETIGVPLIQNELILEKSKDADENSEAEPEPTA
jgi:hypothetical protein